MGYSPDTWDSLTRYLKGKGFTERTLADAGLASKSSHGRLIDRFRGRIMFPIFDLRGDPVGFGARRLEGDGPKYLNTSETSIYHKSRLLYGLNWAKGEIVRRGESVVVEGYTDVIALHLADHPVAVATCGTALGEDHLDLLRRFSERVLLAFDADEAGAGAALRGFDMAVPGDLDMRVVQLPQGRDPADLVGEGDGHLLIAAMKESQPLLQFSVDKELAKHDLNEAEARGRAIRAAAAMVARHPDELVRHEYAVTISRRTGVDLRMVEETVAKAARARSAEVARPPRQQARKLSGTQKAEQELLRLVMANNTEVRQRDIDEDLFSDDLHRAAFVAIWPEIIALEIGASPDLGRIIGSGETAETRLLAELALLDRPESDPADVINRLKVGALTRRIEQLQRSLDNLTPDDQDYSDRLEELLALQQQKKQRLRSRE
jgi:DNA primase